MANQGELVRAVHDDTGIAKSDIERVLGSLSGHIAAALMAGDAVRLAHLGTLAPVERAAGEGRNPRTGAKIAIAARRVVRFRASATLRRDLNPERPKTVAPTRRAGQTAQP